jgi:phage-related protein
MAWHVELIPEAQAELLALPADMRARFLHIAEMLEDFGPQRVGMPHVRPLTRKLWEIRMTGRDGIARAIYMTRTAAGRVARIRQKDAEDAAVCHRDGEPPNH